MRIIRLTLILVFAVALIAPSQLRLNVRAQDQPQAQATAIMRGYRTGYSDGYQTGIGDSAAKSPREFRNKAEYDQANRAYNASWGALEEYRDGYRQGFDVGYGAGYDRKPFDSTIPNDLKRRTEDNTVQYPVDQNKVPGTNGTVNNGTVNNGTVNNGTANDPATSMLIPRDTVMRVELLNELSTEISQQGDPFQVRVADPKQYDGAIIEGHIAQLKRPGKAKGNAELQLSFERIKFPDGRSAKLSGQVIEVVPNGGTQAGKVDPEGGIKGQDSTRSDVGKVGGAAGVGAVIGLIFGGGSGAAVGAGIGAGVGTAGVLTQRGKDIRLTQGQQLRIRTAGDAELQ